jgi:dihydrofolate synthase/folylpolyglutamate synthase
MGLARVTSVARVLRVDQPSYRVITVGGTNGKGSTVAHLDALLSAGGVSSGMFTSPHFIRYNERIRVHGVEVEDAELIEAFERIEQARGSTTLTFFEYNALAALLIFEARKVDVAVLEVGLGGRLDAVNLVDADVAVVCSVGFDHRDYLGESLEEIGAEKAGIFRPGRPAVLGTPDMPQSVYSTIQRVSARSFVAERDFSWQIEGATWSYRGSRIELNNLPPSALAGSIQYRNASASIAAIEVLDTSFALNERTVSQALRQVRLAGRFQVVPGPVEWILDIAHNEPAARVFAQHVRERPAPKGGRTLAVVGILADKDAREIVAAVQPLVDQWIVCALPGPRGTSAADLTSRAQLPAALVTLAASVEAGCEIARSAAVPGDRVIVFGSVYTVGPALRWLRVY